jgi:hypothetical protein
VRVEWATFVQRVTGNPAVPDLHGVGYNSATVDALPKAIPLLMMVRIVTPPDELGSHIPLTLEVADPELEVTQSLEAVANPSAPDNAIPGWEIRNWMPVQLHLQADREGTYTVRVRIDGAMAWELPFTVRLAA